jgi:peptide/nickel transport system permease protein
MRVLKLAGRRLAASIPTLILILIGMFLLLQFAPGDTVDARAIAPRPIAGIRRSR